MHFELFLVCLFPHSSPVHRVTITIIFTIIVLQWLITRMFFIHFYFRFNSWHVTHRRKKNNLWRWFCNPSPQFKNRTDKFLNYSLGLTNRAHGLINRTHEFPICALRFCKPYPRFWNPYPQILRERIAVLCVRCRSWLQKTNAWVLPVLL